ncbi:MAG: hypothetical protein M9888_11555 [Chitinophagales bacterium]|nr:hypothetical protein [Chitinophagales bacterium]
MKRILLSLTTALILASCGQNPSIENKYENQLEKQLKLMEDNGQLSNRDAQLIARYIDATKYDTSYASVEGKTFKEILALVTKKVERDDVVSDPAKINLLLSDAEAALSTVICANQPTPSGFVITSYGNSMSCPGWTPGGMNTKTITRPSNNMTICTTSPIPDGYVVTGYGNSMSCPGWNPGGMNTMTISIPGNTATICASSPVPNGYVVVGYGNSMSCPGWTPGGQNTKTIRRL